MDIHIVSSLLYNKQQIKDLCSFLGKKFRNAIAGLKGMYISDLTAGLGVSNDHPTCFSPGGSMTTSWQKLFQGKDPNR